MEKARYFRDMYNDLIDAGNKLDNELVSYQLNK